MKFCEKVSPLSFLPGCKIAIFIFHTTHSDLIHSFKVIKQLAERLLTMLIKKHLTIMKGTTIQLICNRPTPTSTF